MRRLTKVFRRMTVRRLVTAADVSATETQPQVHPVTADREALLAAVRRAGRDVTDPGQMYAAVRRTPVSHLRASFSGGLKVLAEGRASVRPKERSRHSAVTWKPARSSIARTSLVRYL